MTSGKKWKFGISSINTHEPMRIQKISYVVKAKGKDYVVTMTKVTGLKLRELVPVKKADAKLKQR